MIFTTAIHGDEPIPVFALASFNVSQLICNRQALIKNKRFIEQDMNQSFGTRGNSLEEKRAREILKIIPRSETVIDLHTTSAQSEPFVIVVDLEMLPLAALTGLSRVVYMAFNIKSNHSLIDHRQGVSIEVGRHLDVESFNTVIKIYKNIKRRKRGSFTLYEVYDVIKKKGKYENFKRHPDGFIPILAGERAYKFFGLKARIKRLL